MTDHFICERCGARGHLVKDHDTCPNCGGPISSVVITRPAPLGPCTLCDAYDALAEACAMPSQYPCPLEQKDNALFADNHKKTIEKVEGKSGE